MTKFDTGTQQPDNGQTATHQHQNDYMGLNDAIGGLKDTAGQTPADDGKPLKPEGLPDNFWDAESNQIKTDDLIKAYTTESARAKGLRDKLAKGAGGAPETVDEYEITAPEGFEFTENDADVLNAAKQAGLAAGLTNDQINKFVQHYMLKAQDLLPQELSAEEQKAQEAAYQQEEFKKIGPNAGIIVQAVAGMRETLVNKGILSADEAEVFNGMITTAAQLKVMNSLRSFIGIGDEIPANAGLTPNGLMSDGEIYNLIGSKEYMSGDPAVHRKVEEQLSLRTMSGRTGLLAG